MNNYIDKKYVLGAVSFATIWFSKKKLLINGMANSPNTIAVENSPLSLISNL